MTLAPRLDLRQSQSLVMTPQLQQAIKLLALSNLEIEGFIAEELEKNPLLEAERDEGVATAPEPGEAEPPDALAGGGDEALDTAAAAENGAQDSDADRMGLGGGDAPLPGAGEAPALEDVLAAVPTLAEHLEAQAGERLSGTDRAIASAIIDALDEAGYLTQTLREIADRLGAPLARIEAVLAVVQGFDPTGVAARDLAECLALQAREADRYDPAMAAMIAHLDLVARGALPQLRRLCGVDEEDLADMIRELRGYDPKPGLRFAGGEAPPVVADVFVRATPAGGWTVELNAATLPRLIVNRRYLRELGRTATDRAGKAWLADSVQSANWLIRALDQRARTIVKVASEIVAQQDGFFRHGVEQLRPLTLRTVAEAIGMHESTVSRVTSNKYLACGRGLFELKYFFTSAIQAADGGEAASAAAVKSHIARLIADERGDAILSDDALVELLRARGLDIARRTVAKYRESLGLGSSVQRRRQKLLAS